MAQAAFFDLDKTILAKSSSFAFARPFYREGLIGRTDVVKSAYAQFVFLASGADHDQMESMRDYMSALVTGWEVEKVKTIVDETLDEIVDPMVYEEAVELIDEHRRAGREGSAARGVLWVGGGWRAVWAAQQCWNGWADG